VNSVYSLACMFSHMYSLLYEFLCDFYIPLPLVAASPVSALVGTPVNFDSFLPGQDLTQNHATNCPMCLIIMRIYCKMSERCISYIQGVRPNWR